MKIKRQISELRVTTGMRIFALSLLMFTSACTTVPVERNNVFIRVANNSEVELKNVVFGRRIIKPDSYTNTDYSTTFKRIEPATVTEYKDTRGKHLGYSRIHATKVPRGIAIQGIPKPPFAKAFEGGMESIPNPYTGKALSGYSLPVGYYTFTVTNNSDGFDVSVRRDNSP